MTGWRVDPPFVARVRWSAARAGSRAVPERCPAVAAARKIRRKPLKTLKTGSEMAGGSPCRGFTRRPPAARPLRRPRNPQQAVEKAQNRRRNDRLARRSAVCRPRPLVGGPGRLPCRPGALPGRCGRPENPPQALENAQNRLGNGRTARRPRTYSAAARCSAQAGSGVLWESGSGAGSSGSSSPFDPPLPDPPESHFDRRSR